MLVLVKDETLKLIEEGFEVNENLWDGDDFNLGVFKCGKCGECGKCGKCGKWGEITFGLEREFAVKLDRIKLDGLELNEPILPVLSLLLQIEEECFNTLAGLDLNPILVFGPFEGVFKLVKIYFWRLLELWFGLESKSNSNLSGDGDGEEGTQGKWCLK